MLSQCSELAEIKKSTHYSPYPIIGQNVCPTKRTKFNGQPLYNGKVISTLKFDHEFPRVLPPAWGFHFRIWKSKPNSIPFRQICPPNGTMFF